MAYTPISWQTGDTITADKLNKMDNGWAVESTQLFSETVTTAAQNGMYAAQLAYSGTINADAITVTFDGSEYVCPRLNDGNSRYLYGGFSEQGPVFTKYPFAIMYRNATSVVFTETAGTHTIAVTESILQTSEDFDAVRGYGYKETKLFSETAHSAADHTGETPYATLAYSQLITADTITVTYDGIEYTCPCTSKGEYGAFWGGSGIDFSEFPFNLYTKSGEAAILTTQTTGDHTVAVSAPTLQTSDNFGDAVKETLSTLPFRCVVGVTTITDARKALENGQLVYFTAPEDASVNAENHGFLISAIGPTCTIVPTSTKIEARFNQDSGLFNIGRLSS